MIIIPLPLFGASTVYTIAGFSVWVVVGILWALCSAFAVVLYPLWESRAALGMIVKGMVKVSTLFLWCVDEVERFTFVGCRIYIRLGRAHMLCLRAQRRIQHSQGGMNDRWVMYRHTTNYSKQARGELLCILTRNQTFKTIFASKHDTNSELLITDMTS